MGKTWLARPHTDDQYIDSAIEIRFVAYSVRRQRPWDRYSSGLRESFCSS